MAADVTDAYETLMEFLYRAPIGLAQTSVCGDIEMLNPMSAQLLMPLSPDGGLGNLFAALHTVAPELSQMVADFTAASGVICESLRVETGEEMRAKGAVQVLSINLMKLDASKLMAVVSDASLEVRREQETLSRGLDRAAHIDNLTDMPNRPAIRKRLQALLDRTPSDIVPGFAVIFMNCDRFKQINDSLGHAVGNQILGMMADRLRSVLRQSDSFNREMEIRPTAARIGGDEFVVILEGIQRREDVHLVARRVLEVVSVPYAIETHDINCKVSLGVVMGQQSAGNADALLQDASIAMVEAKRAGGSRYAMFDHAMRERAEQRGGMETELRRAFAERELFVMYQPVVGLQTGAAVQRNAGVEALVRWRHPTRGVVPPLEFIGMAEECGLISELGDFVLATACDDFVQWHRELGAHAPATLAVNLSRGQLTETDAVARIRDILRITGMPAQRLQLEITESLAAQDATIQARLHELKGLGLTLALDDFGTGYSSLACLHLLPVDTVKIDRSFVAQADTSQHHRVLIQATVQVAHSLGMNIVAEGIEAHGQEKVVTELNCDKGQGYLYARPLCNSDLVAWLMAGGD